MSKYLYTIRVEFEAVDDMEAREMMEVAGLKNGFTTESRFAEAVSRATTGARDPVTEKLQRLQDKQPPKLVEWYR